MTRFFSSVNQKDESFRRYDFGQEEHFDRDALSKQAIYDVGVAVTC